MPAEALRRRLYAPGADEQDLVRYRASVPRSDAPVDPPAPVPDRRSRLRRLAPFAAGALTTAALIAALPLVQGPGGAAPAPSPVASGALRIPESARMRFVQALAASESPRVAQYLVLRPDLRPAAMAAATRTVVDEQQGTGTAVVNLHPDLAAASGGRMTVVLTADHAVPVRWSASRTAVRQDHRQYDQVVGQRLQRMRPGVPAAATVQYDGAAPSALFVEARAGTHWDVVVAFTD